MGCLLSRSVRESPRSTQISGPCAVQVTGLVDDPQSDNGEWCLHQRTKPRSFSTFLWFFKSSKLVFHNSIDGIKWKKTTVIIIISGCDFSVRQAIFLTSTGKIAILHSSPGYGAINWKRTIWENDQRHPLTFLPRNIVVQRNDAFVIRSSFLLDQSIFLLHLCSLPWSGLN